MNVLIKKFEQQVLATYESRNNQQLHLIARRAMATNFSHWFDLEAIWRSPLGNLKGVIERFSERQRLKFLGLCSIHPQRHLFGPDQPARLGSPVGRNEIFVFRIRRSQESFASVLHQDFERALIVDQGRDHITRLGCFAVLKNGEVTIEDMFFDHGITFHPESERLLRGFDPKRSGIHRNAFVGLLMSFISESGWNGAVQRDVDDLASSIPERA